MEMMQISSLVERLTDEQLVQELQQPSGMAPLQVIMGEIQRRSGLRGGKPRGFAAGGPVESGGAYEAEIARLFPHLVQQESGGQAGILGPQTRYGQAQGRTQMLPATARQMAERVGVPWRPEMMTGRTPEAAAYQDRLGMEYLREGFNRTGNARDALRYYHGGPDRGIWGRNTNRYADEVLARAGINAPPPPSPSPGLNGADGFSNPENITNESIAAAERIAESLGLGEGIGTIQERYDDVSGMVPDVTEPYEAAIARLQQEEGRERQSNRGRSLIDAGLAMMSAETPNFMSALAAGGQAGFASRDRIQAEERGLMQSVIQAQLARSQAEQQRAASILNSAAGLYEGDRRTLTGAYGAGIELGLGGARSRDASAENKSRVDQNNLDRDSREREGAADRALREKEFGARAYQEAYAAAARAGAVMAMRPKLDGSAGTEYRVATEAEIAADARRIAGASAPAAPASGGAQIIAVDGNPVGAPASPAAPARAPAAPARTPAPPVRAPARPAVPLPADHAMREQVRVQEEREAAAARAREVRRAEERRRQQQRREAMRPSAPARTGPRADQAMYDRYKDR